MISHSGSNESFIKVAAVAAMVMLMVIAAASMASAILPPDQYKAMRAMAGYHLQIRVVEVTAPTDGKRKRSCTVRGRVVSIFRSPPGRMALEDEVAFPVSCRLDDDTDDEILVGPDAVFAVRELNESPFIEVYLNRTEKGFVLADYGMGIRLSSCPTDTPLSVDAP
ncbi:MAG: hypothetical protein ISR44_04360 [Rhodospirillales bacterium]|nr:hypothetical protein [Rhodospirillales bacterium]